MMLRQICLEGQSIDCQVKRSRRKTVGLSITHQGLQVNAPKEFSDIAIDELVQSKSDWILNKLAVWGNKTSLDPFGSQNDSAEYLLFGQVWKPKIDAIGRIQMVRDDTHATKQSEHRDLSESARKWIMNWYRQHAEKYFNTRIAFYADELNIPKPSFKLSRARTRWGSCNNRGVIRLNWRLVQLPVHLIDYVIVHELCHLIEMNHSRNFWALVAGIYPNYRQAQGGLSRYCL